MTHETFFMWRLTYKRNPLSEMLGQTALFTDETEARICGWSLLGRGYSVWLERIDNPKMEWIGGTFHNVKL